MKNTVSQNKDFYQDLDELKFILEQTNYSSLHLIEYFKSELYRQKLGKNLVFYKSDKNKTRRKYAREDVKSLKAEYNKLRDGATPRFIFIPIHHLRNIIKLNMACILAFIEITARKMRGKDWALVKQSAIAEKHGYSPISISRAVKFLIEAGLILRAKLPFFVRRAVGGKYLLPRFYNTSRTFYKNVKIKLTLLNIQNLINLLKSEIIKTAPPPLTFKEMLVKQGLNFSFNW